MGLGAVHAVRRGSDGNSDSRHRTAGWKAMQIITTMSSGWVSNTQHQKVVCTKYYAACLKINGNMVFFFGLIAPQIPTLGMALACSTLSPELKQVLWKDLKCELHSRCFHDSHQNIHYKKKKKQLSAEKLCWSTLFCERLAFWPERTSAYRSILGLTLFQLFRIFLCTASLLLLPSSWTH